MVSSEEARRHNEQVLADLEIGDRIQIDRGSFFHWALYVGEGDVVHLSGPHDQIISSLKGHLASVSGYPTNLGTHKKENFFEVVADSFAYKDNSKDGKYTPLEPSTIRKRALAQVGKSDYHVLFKNCEHFANWCRYNQNESDQVNLGFRALAVLGAITAVVVIILAEIVHF